MRVKFFRKESSSFRDDFLHALKVAMVVCPTAVVFITMFYTVPAIETRYFPVVTNFHITKIVAVDGGSMVSAEADKVRECPRWRLTLWYYGQRDGGNVPLPTMQHLDPPRVNGTGRVKWERIFVPVPPDQIKNTFSDAYHACWPWEWWTRSELYNPPLKG
jgi:hypothetical protein